jgi:hypothetical protein
MFLPKMGIISQYILLFTCLVFYHLIFSILKIPKEQSESVYRRSTDNTMAKRKSTKGQTTIYKTYM